MPQNCLDPRPSLSRDTFSDLALIAAVVVLYPIMLIGTSAIIANPEPAQVQMRQDMSNAVGFRDWRLFPRTGFASTARHNGSVH